MGFVHEQYNIVLSNIVCYSLVGCGLEAEFIVSVACTVHVHVFAVEGMPVITHGEIRLIHCVL